MTVGRKKYDISDVATVQDLQDQLQKKAGVDMSQYRILAGSELLDDDDVLLEVGVKNGAKLKAVSDKKRSKVATRKLKPADKLRECAQMIHRIADNPEQLVMSTSDLQESLKRFVIMENCTQFQELINDSEEIERMRQTLLKARLHKLILVVTSDMHEIQWLKLTTAQQMALVASVGLTEDLKRTVKQFQELVALEADQNCGNCVRASEYSSVVMNLDVPSMIDKMMEETTDAIDELRNALGCLANERDAIADDPKAWRGLLAAMIPRIVELVEDEDFKLHMEGKVLKDDGQ